MAALLGLVTAGSLRGPLEIAVGCGAILLAEGLALLALVPENLRARAAAHGALVIGGLALVLAIVAGIGYWRVSLDPGLVRRYAGAYQVTAICANGGGWLLAVLTVVGLVWGALAVVAPPPLDSSPGDVPGVPERLRPAWQRSPSPWRGHYAGLGEIRRQVWPWLDVYTILCVIQLVAAGIRAVRATGSASLSSDDLIVSFGGLVVWSVLVNSITYRNRRLSRERLVRWLTAWSLITLAHIGLDVARIMAS